MIVSAVIMLSVGQILFKMAALSLPQVICCEFRNLLQPTLLFALTIYGFATILWIAVLRITPLRVAYPFAALAFIFVPLLAWWWLGEPLKWNTFVGAAIILVGVMVAVGVG